VSSGSFLKSFSRTCKRWLKGSRRTLPISMGRGQHSSSAAVIVRRRRCCPLPPSLSTAAIFRRHSHHCHSAVSAFSRRPLLSFPIVVRRLVLHAIVFCHYRCPPLPSSSAAAVFHRHSHHHHSAVSAVSHRPSSPSPSQSVAQSCMSSSSTTVVIRHRRCALSPYLRSSYLLP
jgi:hypothetical protein